MLGGGRPENRRFIWLAVKGIAVHRSSLAASRTELKTSCFLNDRPWKSKKMLSLLWAQRPVAQTFLDRLSAV